MSIALVVPAVVGALAVLQATLNRQLAQRWGLAPAAVLNMLVALTLALTFLSWCVLRGTGVGISRVSFDLTVMRWWWLVPGACGAAIVFGLPWAVEKIGALPVFVVLVGSQMCASAAWDRWVEGIPLTTPRLAGALLAVLSVALVSWK